MTSWTPGDISSSQTLTDSDHLYPGHINELRVALNKSVSTFVVTNYGATGNGSTDDTSAIQDAIDAAELAGGGIVFIPIGTYKITSAIVNNSDGVSIVGESRSGTRIDVATADISGFRFHESNDFELSCMTITSSITKSDGYGVFFDGTPTRFHVHDINIEKQYVGIGGSPARGLVNNLDLLNQIHAHIKLIGNGADSRFENTLVRNTLGVTTSDIGIYIYGAVNGPTFTNIDIVGSNIGVRIDNGNSSNATEWLFFDTVMTDTIQSNGWEIGYGTGQVCRGISLNGCWSATCGDHGMVVKANSRDILIIGSRVVHNNKHGIYLEGGNQVSVTGNSVINNSVESAGTYDGIHVAPNLNEFKISGNKCISGISSYASGTAGYGIQVASGTATNYYQISDNMCYPNLSGYVNDLGAGTTKYVQGDWS